MSVTVDASRCQGHGRCYMLSPSVFRADDQGMSVVIDGSWTPQRSAAAAVAAENCPEGAVVVDLAAGEAG